MLVFSFLSKRLVYRFLRNTRYDMCSNISFVYQVRRGPLNSCQVGAARNSLKLENNTEQTDIDIISTHFYRSICVVCSHST